MIVILSYKEFNKYKKKLIKHRDFIIVNGTDRALDDTNYYCNFSFPAFSPDKKVYMKPEKDLLDFAFDEERMDKARAKYFKSESFLLAVHSVIDSYLIAKGTNNVFILTKPKVASKFSHRIIKYINKFVGFDIACDLNKVLENPKLIKKKIDDSDLYKLNDKFKELGLRLRK